MDENWYILDIYWYLAIYGHGYFEYQWQMFFYSKYVYIFDFLYLSNFSQFSPDTIQNFDSFASLRRFIANSDSSNIAFWHVSLVMNGKMMEF